MRALQVLFRMTKQAEGFLPDLGTIYNSGKNLWNAASSGVKAIRGETPEEMLLKAQKEQQAKQDLAFRTSQKEQSSPGGKINAAKVTPLPKYQKAQDEAASKAKATVSEANTEAETRLADLMSNPANRKAIQQILVETEPGNGFKEINPLDSRTSDQRIDDFIAKNPQQALARVNNHPASKHLLMGNKELADKAQLAAQALGVGNTGFGGLASTIAASDKINPKLMDNPRYHPLHVGKQVATDIANKITGVFNPLGAAAAAAVKNNPGVDPRKPPPPKLPDDPLGIKSLPYIGRHPAPASPPPPKKDPPASEPWYKNTAVLGGAGLVGAGGLAALLAYYNRKKKKKHNYDEALEDEYNRG